ncbi:alpha/beta fold hydrolase [Vagococcus carniphilus]|uniref:alpha/beta hydrolase n=1 Tax=Vagococcus carniphilus TaxID=218144 RepID=UPI003B5A6268
MTIKKIGKWFLRIVLAIVGIIVVALVVTATVNQIALSKETKKIENYGQKIDVFDGKMNVRIDGKGKETIVLLPGYGTPSPGIDFKPLINELKSDYQVLTIEPFGYGLSSQTKRERTLENVTEEIHYVLKQLKIESFILMGHSISGIYGMNYVNTYPNEVKAFVGIDTSVPNQPWPGNPTKTIDFLRYSGVLRLFTKMRPELFEYPHLTKEENEQYRMLNLKNTGNQSMRSEGIELDNSFEKVKTMTFPKSLPLLLFIDHGNAETVPTWRDLHLKQVKNANKGASFELEGGHYLHRTQSKKIVSEMKQFLND